MVAVLAIAGLILVFLEFFLPSGIMAIGGGILLASSLALLAIKQPGVSILAAYAGLLAVLLFAVIRLALSKTKKSEVRLESGSEEFQASVYSKEMIGKTAIAVSDLKPSGYVQIEEAAFAALSKSGDIEKGARVRICGGEGASLIVDLETPHN